MTAQRHRSASPRSSKRQAITKLAPAKHLDEKVLDQLYHQIEENRRALIERLRQAVGIASVSGQAISRPEVLRMGEWLTKELEQLGFKVQQVHPGMQQLDGQSIPLPPILLASTERDESKRTLLVYGHYDVQPAQLEDGWSTEPFELVEAEDGRLIGRGSTDDKGPILGWLAAVEAHRQLGIELPVNLQCCFEGMEESGSEGLDDVIRQEAHRAFQHVDVVTISDNYWLSKTKPCLTYGLRGVSYFCVTIEGPAADLHSGVFGGTVHEPMIDLAHLMSKMVTVKGRILIDGIDEDVAPLTDKELAMYEDIDFNMKDFHQSLGAKNTIYDNEKETLLHRWRYPSFSFHGVQGAFYGNGAKTVIPAKVIGKFSIRTVPNMDPEKVSHLVKSFVEKTFASLGSKNKCTLEAHHGGRSWLSDVNHWNYKAGAKAIERVFGVVPDFTREGGSIPVTLTFQESLSKNVMLLPMGACDDGAHSINEKLDTRNYIEGIKLFITYLHELAAAEV